MANKKTTEKSNTCTQSVSDAAAYTSAYTSGDLKCKLDGFTERLKKARKKVGFSQAKLGELVGLSENAIYNYESGSLPTGKNLAALSYHLKCSTDWLLTGEEKGVETVEPEHKNKPAVESAREINTSKFTLVPKVKARLNAGDGSLLTGDEITGRYAFKNDWIRQKGDPGQMVLLDVFGESMEPVIWDGDTVLVDQSQTEVIPGRIYAVGIEDTVMIKYVELRPGVMALKSANEKWNDIEVDIRGDLAKSVRIVGRVIWWCREAR